MILAPHQATPTALLTSRGYLLYLSKYHPYLAIYYTYRSITHIWYQPLSYYVFLI